MNKGNTYKHIIYKNAPDTSTPINADTFNDIWNAIDCIDYRLINMEEQMSSRKKQSIKIILAFILFELLIIGITILLCH